MTLRKNKKKCSAPHTADFRSARARHRAYSRRNASIGDTECLQERSVALNPARRREEPPREPSVQGRKATPTCHRFQVFGSGTRDIGIAESDEKHRGKSESRDSMQQPGETRGVEEGAGREAGRKTSRGSAEPGSASRYAPKAAAAARHEMPVIVAFIAVLLRLLHGLVIVLLLAGGGGLGGRDRGRLLAARVHPCGRTGDSRAPKAAKGERERDQQSWSTSWRSCPHTPIRCRFPRVVGPSAPRLAREERKKNAADKLLFYADAARKHVAANMREFP